MEKLEELWGAIDSEWPSILKILKDRLDTSSYERFTDDGHLVRSERPMIESIISDKAIRSKSLLFYLLAAGLADTQEEVNSGGRVFNVSASNRINLNSGT